MAESPAPAAGLLVPAGRPALDAQHLSVVRETCDNALAHIDDIVDTVVTKIRESVPEYANVPYEHHVKTMRALQAKLYQRLRVLDQPTALDIQAARALGRLRASQGVPLEPLIVAYQVSHLEVLDVFRTNMPTSSAVMGDVATSLLTRLQVIIQAVSAGYRAGRSAEETSTQLLQRRLVRAVIDGVDDIEIAELATDLGLSPDGDFVAAWIEPVGEPERLLALATKATRDLPAMACMVGHDTVVLTQLVSVERLRGKLADVGAPARIGIGMKRAGLAGAHLSLGDAQRAAALAAPTGAVEVFEENWVWSCVHTERDRLQPLLDKPVAVALKNPHLVETVREFAAAGFSVKKTAERLFIHPNTASYRIDRWRQLSGLDLRTANGLAASLVVIALLGED